MKRIILCITMVLMFACMLPVVTACAETESPEFVIENGVLKAYNGESTKVVVPDGVTEIGEWCFCNNRTIVSVVLPESVEKIQRSAFLDCEKLKTISSLKQVKVIGDQAFTGCEELEDIGSLDSLKKIGSGAFVNTSWLENERKKSPLVIANGILFDGSACIGEVVIPQGVVEIAESAFSCNPKITGIIMPDSVKIIKDSAFYACHYLRYVRMGDSVESIGEYIFEDCRRLRDIRLSASLKEFTDGLWGDAGLRNLTIPPSVSYINSECLESCDKLQKISVDPYGVKDQAEQLAAAIAITCSDDLTIYSRLSEMDERSKEILSKQAKLEELALETESLWMNPGEVYALAMNSEAKCDSWKSDNPSVVKVDRFGKITAKQPGKAVITTLLFGKEYRCTVRVTNPNKLQEESPSELFTYELVDGEIWITGLNDTSQTQIWIPEQIEGWPVEYIKECAFAFNENLMRVIVPDNVKEIMHRAFYGCSSLTEIELPEEMEYIGWGAFWGCKSLKEIRIPKGIDIASEMFEGCCSLAEIILPEGMQDIWYNAFWGCESLKSIRIPQSVTAIGNNAFAYCSSLTEVDMPDCVEDIGKDAFCNTPWLDQKEEEKGWIVSGETLHWVARRYEGVFRIPETVTTIGEYAFGGCSRLTGVEIPASVKDIKENAFAGCSGLETIELPDGITKIESKVFENCSGLKEVKMPGSVEAIGVSAFQGCNSLMKVEIPKSVKKIKAYAFSGCSSLTEVRIPEGMNVISTEAFFNCSSLVHVELPKSMSLIVKDAFDGCNSALEFIVPKDSYAEKYVKKYHTKR